MNPITIQNPDEILNMLADVTLRGTGFTTESLLDYVLEEGFTEPIFLNASGEDPTAFFKGQPNAWAIYQIREWKRVLKSGGILRISVPDFDRILAIYEAFQHNIAAIEKTLMGGQNYPANFHKAVFNPAHLTRLLEAAGFTNVRAWTPGSGDLTTFNDWSGRSVKVEDKAFPISLNLEAEKPKQ